MSSLKVTYFSLLFIVFLCVLYLSSISKLIFFLPAHFLVPLHTPSFPPILQASPADAEHLVQAPPKLPRMPQSTLINCNMQIYKSIDSQRAHPWILDFRRF